MLRDLLSRFVQCIIMGDFNVDIYIHGYEIRNVCSRMDLELVHNVYDLVSTKPPFIDYTLVSNVTLIHRKGQFKFPILYFILESVHNAP